MSPLTRPFTGRLADGDMRLFRIFCAVTECGGFAAAESELQMGLPSISRSIKDLETRLGLRLCRRGRRGFSLTDQGRHIYEASLRFLHNMEQFEADIRTVHTELNGVLRIGMADTLITDPQFQLAEVLTEFRRRHPGVSINLSVQTSNQIEQRIIDGSMHIGFVVVRRHSDRLRYRALYSEMCSLYCTSDHPLAIKGEAAIIEDLFRHDYVGYTYADGAGRPIGGTRRILIPAAQVDHSEALATLVATGSYFGFLPDHYVSAMWRCSGFSVILKELAFASKVELVTSQGEPSPLLKAFDEIFERKFKTVTSPGDAD
ncbi:MAG TPA: LysR family transcriptional regulator [Sphingobium sp.]